MIATPITDEFIKDFDGVLWRVHPNTIEMIAAQYNEWKELVVLEDFKNDKSFISPQEKLLALLTYTSDIARTFWNRVKEAKREAEDLIVVDDISRWVHIFRVKYDKILPLLNQAEDNYKNQGYIRIFQQLANTGIIESSLIFRLSMMADDIIRHCRVAWSDLKDFFEECKKMAVVPELTITPITLQPSHKDFFPVYKEILIPKYISLAQELELKNLLKVFHTPNRINWLGTIDSLVSTVYELSNKGAITIAEGVTIKQYILYNFIQKGKAIKPGPLSNAISKPENKP